MNDLYKFAARNRSLRHLLVLGMMLLGTAFFALGQVERATIVGTVTDPSGAVVPNVAVTATNTDTNLASHTTSNEAGEFTFTDIALGHYNIRAEATGFKVSERTGLTLNVGDRSRVDFTLTVGATKDVVTVEANAVRVQSDSGEISTVISGTQVTQLQMNGRSLYAMSALTPGASTDGSAQDFQVPTGNAGDGNVSFNGQRVAHNMMLVDGGENADRGGGAADTMPSLDAIAEFRNLTSNYDAQYGLSSSGTVSTVLKSGTKQFHGGAWEFDRNDDFNARNYFQPRQNANGTLNGVGELRFNIYGFNIGGPVEFKHSDNPKTFFFYNMEWRSYVTGSQFNNRTTPIPSTYGGNLNAALAVGNLSNSGTTGVIIPFAQANELGSGAPGLSTAEVAAFNAQGITDTCTATPCPAGTFGGPWVNNTIPTALLNPNTQAILKAGIYPTPNSGVDTYSVSDRAPTSVREEIARVDHTFNDKFSIFGHWISEQVLVTDEPTRWSGDNLPTVGDTFGSPAYSAVVHATYSISPTLLNETAFNYDGNRISILGIGNGLLPAGFTQNKLFSSPNPNLPVISLQGRTGANFDEQWVPWINAANDYNAKDDLSWTKGAHQIKMGFGWANYRKSQPLQDDTQGSFGFNGVFTNYDFADELLGLAQNYSEAALKDTRQWNSVSWDAYVQDNWRATHRLTLNLGLRWDGIPHTGEINGQMSNFYPNLYTAANAPVFANSSGTQICSAASLLVAGNTCGGKVSPALASGPNPALNGLLSYTNGLGVPGQTPGVTDGLVNNHWWNFGPRLGVAYDLTGSGKTILRAGFGTMFERVQGNDMYQAGANNLFGGNPSLNDVSFQNPHTGIDAQNATISAAALPVTVNGLTQLNSNVYKNPVTYQYSGGVQQQLGSSSVLSLSYVGAQNRFQSEATNVNVLPQADWTVANVGSIRNTLLPYLGYGAILADQNDASGHYNSFQAELHTHLKRGLLLQAAYTLARGLDSSTNTQDGGDLDTTTNPYLGWKYDMGPSSFDRKQVGFADFVYDLPIFRSTDNRLAHDVIGGWQLSGIITMESGLPLNLGISQGNNIGSFVQDSSLRPNLTGPVSYLASDAKNPNNGNNTIQWFAPQSFSIAETPINGSNFATFGNLGHNAIRGPGRDQWQLSMYKSFAFTERAHLELRFECYNVFNHTQFNGINSTVGGTGLGQANSAFDPREFQFGGKFLF